MINHKHLFMCLLGICNLESCRKNVSTLLVSLAGNPTQLFLLEKLPFFVFWVSVPLCFWSSLSVPHCQASSKHLFFFQLTVKCWCFAGFHFLNSLHISLPSQLCYFYYKCHSLDVNFPILILILTSHQLKSLYWLIP